MQLRLWIWKTRAKRWTRRTMRLLKEGRWKKGGHGFQPGCRLCNLRLVLAAAGPITSARSSDTDMTDCSIVLPGGGAACQCHDINFCSAVYQQNKLYRIVYDDSRQLEWLVPVTGCRRSRCGRSSLRLLQPSSFIVKYASNPFIVSAARSCFRNADGQVLQTVIFTSCLQAWSST